MFTRNHSENSLEKNQKILIITKPQPKDMTKIMKHKKLLFNDPSNYLKLPNELNFKFIIGKKKKIIKDIVVDRKPVKNNTNKFIKMLAKRGTRMKSSSNLSFDIKRVFESNKTINLNSENDKSILRKKRAEEVSNIFSNYRKIITEKEKDKSNNNIVYNSEVPSFITEYINKNLSQQEKALKFKEEYNNIFNQMEKNISKTMLRENKTPNSISIKNKFENKFYETANLFKNSIENYRNKIEKIKLNTKKKIKNKNLHLDFYIRNWEMSLRKPKNFTGSRKGYLNASSDKRPIWIIATENYPVEEEKIINPYNFNKSGLTRSKTDYNVNSNKIIFSNYKNKTMNSIKYNDLQIKGKKLIDFEEKQADRLNGNIKILHFKYDNDSIKDLLFKRNFSINKYSLN